MATLKVLVVEDDIPSLELMTEVFTSLNTDVRPLSDSLKAAEVVNREKFDGIFLDIEMPNLDGLELAQRIRKSSWNKSTPIIIVTAREERDTMYHAFAAGSTFFLQKPVDRMKLSNLLRTVQGPLYEGRRRYTRVPIQTEVICVVGPRTLTGMTWNMSQGGMQVEIHGLEPGDMAELSFRLPSPPLRIETFAHVVWSKDGRQGVQFIKMNIEHQLIVRDYITQVSLSPQ
jgi:CheY-like chemotaxis protein